MFAERRRRLMDSMDGGVAVLFTAPERVKSNDTLYKYQPDTYFYYLTGFVEPEAVLVLRPGHPTEETILFVRPRDPERETWDGRRAGPEGACSDFGADAAHSMAELTKLLPDLLENQEKLFYAMGRHPEHDGRVLAALETVKGRVRNGVRAPSAIVDPTAILSEMRLIKDETELDLMRRAASISSEAHREGMKLARPGIREFEVEAAMEFVFRREGGAGAAYSTIAGTGVNATILHYIENNDTLRDGEMFLVDAGAQYHGYCADITRTYPVSGTFTNPQRDLYQVVLDAQLAAIEKARVGTHWNEVHETAVASLVEGMVRLGILKGKPAELIAAEAYKPYYMHKTGHWLGLDVHDVGDYRNGSNWRKLQPGMVLTVEPGLYFPQDAEVPESYRGMGIRIEDDVLVTDGAPEVLTAETPKTIAEVEATMAHSPSEPLASTS